MDTLKGKVHLLCTVVYGDSNATYCTRATTYERLKKFLLENKMLLIRISCAPSFFEIRGLSWITYD